MIPAEYSDGGEELHSSGTIHGLVTDLAADTAAERQVARQALVDIGERAVPALTRELQSWQAHVRWEAAKALSEIGDRRAVPALLRALEDSDASVRWMAARGLIAVGRPALIPLLEALEQSADSIRMREGARRVLYTMVQEGTAEEAAPVLDVLEDIEAPTEAPGVAFTVLQRLYRAEPRAIGVHPTMQGGDDDLR